MGRGNLKRGSYYKSPRKEMVSYAFEHLIYNIKSYNGVEI